MIIGIAAVLIVVTLIIMLLAMREESSSSSAVTPIPAQPSPSNNAAGSSQFQSFRTQHPMIRSHRTRPQQTCRSPSTRVYKLRPRNRSPIPHHIRRQRPTMSRGRPQPIPRPTAQPNPLPRPQLTRLHPPP